jgi:dihydroorotase/N-acyl-D-amino-acid deacylase
MKSYGRKILLMVSVFCLCSCASQSQPPEKVFDIILAGGTIYGGDGGPGKTGDLGISADRIVAVGDLASAKAAMRLDVSGLAVTPGFIDIHSHAVRDRVEDSGIFLWPDAENYIRQGVTTIIGGPDGGSWYPISTLLARLEESPASVNFGTFVGHNRIRQLAMGRENRAPTDAELAAMEVMVRKAMEDGAFGLSSGLKYVPGTYAETDEVVDLARVAGEHGGIYITHMREEGTGLLDSVRETISIAERAGLPAQITHHKAMGVSMWGKSVDSLALVDAANDSGLDISSDVYPYAASSTGIKVLFPAWSLAGDKQTRMARLQDPAVREQVKAGLIENLRYDRGGNDLYRVVIAECKWGPQYNGKSLAEILSQREVEPSMENAAELVMELEKNGSCSAVYHAMSEEDVERIMQHPRTMIGSDGGIFIPGDNVPHPRNYGSFARVLGVYVRERGVLELPEAINKMTQMPADRLSLAERGRIAPGAYADIAVFDPATIGDTATFENPHQFAVGVLHVFVNGKAVLLNGQMTGARPGRTLRSVQHDRLVTTAAKQP